MALHAQLAKRLRMDIYFCDPHSPWQRGSNENTNGLLRQYYPKGVDLSSVSQAQLDAVARKLNTRPRKTLQWKIQHTFLTLEPISNSFQEHRDAGKLHGSEEIAGVVFPTDGRATVAQR